MPSTCQATTSSMRIRLPSRLRYFSGYFCPCQNTNDSTRRYANGTMSSLCTCGVSVESVKPPVLCLSTTATLSDGLIPSSRSCCSSPSSRAIFARKSCEASTCASCPFPSDATLPSVAATATTIPSAVRRWLCQKLGSSIELAAHPWRDRNNAIALLLVRAGPVRAGEGKLVVVSSKSCPISGTNTTSHPARRVPMYEEFVTDLG